jgi:hypothetical protein
MFLANMLINHWMLRYGWLCNCCRNHTIFFQVHRMCRTSAVVKLGMQFYLAMQVTFTAHLINLCLIILIIFGEE